MVLEIDSMPERFGTLITLKGFLACVDQLVCFECDCTGEAFPTHTAHKDLLAGVYVGVAVKILPEAETAATDLTSIWFLSCVDDGVRL